MEKALTVILLFISSFKVYSQSLIANGSFESLYDCPKYVGDIEYCHGWHNGGLTPDLFSRCTNGQENGLNIPNSYVGNILPSDGNNVAGLLLFSNKSELPKSANYLITESIWTKLNNFTIKDKTYRFQIETALADSAVFYSNYITITLSTVAFNQLEKKKTIVQTLIIKLDSKNHSKKAWQLSSIDFKSNDNWQFVSIGLLRPVYSIDSFKSNIISNRIKDKVFGDCYYFIDNVSLNAKE